MPAQGIWTSISNRFKHSTIDVAAPLVSADCQMSNDTYITSAFSGTTNYDTSVSLFAGFYTYDPGGGGELAGANAKSWLKPDLSSIPADVDITNVVLKMWCTRPSSGTLTLRFYRCLRDVVSNQATNIIWKTANNWATAGAGNSSFDYDGAVELGGIAISSGAPGYALQSIPLLVSEMIKFYDGTYTNNGILVVPSGSEFVSIKSLEDATPANRPVMSFYY